MIRTFAGHSVVDISDADDAHGQRDFLPAQTSGIAPTVKLLVVRAYNRRDGSQGMDWVQKSCADLDQTASLKIHCSCYGEERSAEVLRVML